MSLEVVLFYLNTMRPVNNGHPRDWLNCPLCTDDRITYTLVDHNVESHIGTYQTWAL